MIKASLYLPGDKVYYVGERFKDRLNGKPGWIHWYVNGVEDTFIVEFPDTRNPKDMEDVDDYIMHAKVLTTRRPHIVERDKDKKQEGPEIQPRRRAKRPEEE